ncbi:hypothetical protein A2U01_0033357, partial [Trifolium medium]|nr:hypothetical protein [Trifolium medium]
CVLEGRMAGERKILLKVDLECWPERMDCSVGWRQEISDLSDVPISVEDPGDE